MDDLTITTTTRVQARWLLTALDDTVNWARMKFKPNKSRKSPRGSTYKCKGKIYHQ